MANEPAHLCLGLYDDVESAERDYQALKILHTSGRVAAYDAAVVFKDHDGKVAIQDRKKDQATATWTGLGLGAFVGLQHEIDGLVHISQISEERVEKIKNVLKVGQDVNARVVKIDRSERRIGLSIKAASYSDDQLKEEQKILDSLKPGEDLVALQHAFDAFDDAKAE